MSRSDELRRAQDAKRRTEQPWRAWYNKAAWKLRARRQLKLEPLCRMCKAMGKSVPAQAADHVVPHRGVWAAFWYGELQSLCETCHSSAKQREEHEGFSRSIGEDGFPVDPRHPFNKP